MNCREFDALVTEPAPDERTVQHAAGCPRCAARLAEQRRLTAALRALAVEGPRQAPDRVEKALLAAFRATAPVRTVPRRSLPWGAWTAAAAAAALLLAAGVWLSSSGPAKHPAPVETAAAPPLPAAAQGTVPPAPARLRRPRPSAVAEPEPPLPAFIPLPGAPAPLDGDLYVARIRAPRAALIAAGVPMNMERAGEAVQADVVFTLDGTPRAIRILHTHNRR